MTDNENILTEVNEPTGSNMLAEAFMAIRGRLHRAAMAILRNRMDADDAVQEAYVRMSARQQAGSDAEARGKLFRTMRNTCIDMLRERTRYGPESVVV